MTENELLAGLEAQMRHDQASKVAQKVVQMLIFTMDAPDEITQEVQDDFVDLMHNAVRDFIVLSDFEIEYDAAAASIGVIGTVLLEVVTNLPTYLKPFATE
jgi:hypothetical protein